MRVYLGRFVTNVADGQVEKVCDWLRGADLTLWRFERVRLFDPEEVVWRLFLCELDPRGVLYHRLWGQYPSVEQAKAHAKAARPTPPLTGEG